MCLSPSRSPVAQAGARGFDSDEEVPSSVGLAFRERKDKEAPKPARKDLNRLRRHANQVPAISQGKTENRGTFAAAHTRLCKVIYACRRYFPKFLRHSQTAEPWEQLVLSAGRV